MLYLTLLFFIKDGKEVVFQQYEDAVLSLLDIYNGKLIYRLRPGIEAVIQHTEEIPYEIHLVSFPNEVDFRRYLDDEFRKSFFHLKEEAIKQSYVIKGFKM